MSLAPGSRLGPYDVVSLVGAGGMGEVYRATDTRLDRTVAIKILPPEVSDNPVRRQRLEAEARTISTLTHPRICALYDVGEQNGIRFLVMEYLEGEDARAAPAARSDAPRSSTTLRDRDCGCAGPRAPRWHRPSRSETVEHHADACRRKAPGFRPRQDDRGAGAAVSARR
jgi:Protein kinase domain